MKTCQKEDCNNRVFSHNYCRWHQASRPDFKPSLLKRQPVNKVSDKERIRQQQYRKQRIAFLAYIPNCEVGAEGCTRISTEVHHRAGRIGSNLLDISTWLSVCHNCHHLIESRPLWAKENGFSVSRLNKAS